MKVRSWGFLPCVIQLIESGSLQKECARLALGGTLFDPWQEALVQRVKLAAELPGCSIMLLYVFK